MTDKFYQLVLFSGFLGFADFLIDVAQSGGVFGIRHNRERCFKKFSRIGVPALSSPHFPEPSEGAVIPWVFIEGCEISLFGRCNFSRLEKLFAELVLSPGNILI